MFCLDSLVLLTPSWEGAGHVTSKIIQTRNMPIYKFCFCFVFLCSQVREGTHYLCQWAIRIRSTINLNDNEKNRTIYFRKVMFKSELPLFCNTNKYWTRIKHVKKGTTWVIHVHLSWQQKCDFSVWNIISNITICLLLMVPT